MLSNSRTRRSAAALSADSGRKTMIVLQAIFIIAVLALLVLGFLRRNMPRVGGKLGPIRAVDPPRELPSGFSRTYTREVTLFVASDASRFATLKAFLRDGTTRLPVVMRIYCVAGCKAEIEISEEAADYERIDAAQALALLRELPDLRRVHRLHLSDQRSFLDPWARKVRGEEFFYLGHATNFSLIVLYKPDRLSASASAPRFFMNGCISSPSPPRSSSGGSGGPMRSNRSRLWR